MSNQKNSSGIFGQNSNTLRKIFWTEQIFFEDNKERKIGRDEKGCKMDVEGRQWMSTVDQLEKGRLTS